MNNNSDHTGKTILFFDGVCNLCNGFVQWMIRRDPKQHFYFASLQSDFAKDFLQALGEDSSSLQTVMLYRDGKIYKESDVSLQVASQLGFPWKLAYPIKFIPRIIRDSIYRWIANNRYRWFGKQESCMMPTPELQNRFLDTLGS